MTIVALLAGTCILAKLFHLSWLCGAPAPLPPPPPVQPQAPAKQTYSTFAGDAGNPLTQPGLLKPQPPTSPNAFIPLPPVR